MQLFTLQSQTQTQTQKSKVNKARYFDSPVAIH